MKKTVISLIPEKLSAESFAPYGQVLLGSVGKPNYKGKGWTSLFPSVKINIPDGELGWVIATKSSKNIIPGMEREPEVEMIWPINGSIVQTVGLPGNLHDHSEQPDAGNIKAFVVNPGQVIIMNPGTWHYAALPFKQKKVTYYFLTKDHPREPGWEKVAWVPFLENKIITI